MLGDVAIAVHPSDERYRHFVGKFAKHPFDNKKIPIIVDDVIVDLNIGISETIYSKEG